MAGFGNGRRNTADFVRWQLSRARGGAGLVASATCS
jgi:hypothetical protein